MEAVNEGESLSVKLKYLLIFGRVIGAWSNRTVWNRIIGFIPIILLIVACVDLIGIFILSQEKVRTATDLAKNIGSPWFYGSGAFLYFYIQRNVHQFKNIFKKWNELQFQNADTKLQRFANFVTFGMLSSAILENVAFHFKLFPVFEELVPNKSSLQVYYERSHIHWAKNIPFSPITAVMLLITNKWAVYIWNFVDILAAILCRALHFRFSNLLRHRGSDCDAKPNLNRVWKEYIHMIDVVKLVEELLSPVIFACYSINLYAICMQLHMWLSPSESHHFLHTLYLAWSFVHLLARVLLVSVNAAKVHEEIRRFEMNIQDFMDENYAKQFERLEYGNNGTRRGLGLTGMGCFLITKPFILTIFSVAFTLEIFLLQSDNIKIR